ncbi:MAG: RNA polymerase sigma-70 factor [Flavobacteriaceae bacterium]|nr:RNA polymerase sigma-70 factor [Flavobacteriaceae bacterium]
MYVSDSKLLTLFKEGNEMAFERIYDRYWRRLYLFASKLLPNEIDAKDILQEVFYNLWTKADQLEINQLESYLFSMTKNKCFDHVRKHKSNDDLTERLVQTLLAENNTENQMDYIETKVNLERGIAHLPSRTKQIFQMSRDTELSNKEIAAKLNISVKTVEYHITQSIKYLKEVLVP